MAGSSGTDKRVAYVIETTGGVTPTTPAFNVVSFEEANFTANSIIKEVKTQQSKGSVQALVRNGFEHSGSASGDLIYGVYDDFLALMLQSDWDNDVLLNGLNSKTMSVEVAIPQGKGGALTHMRYRGVEATGGTLTMEAQESVKLSLDFLAVGSDNATADAIAGATYVSPTSITPISAGKDLGLLTMAGFAPLDCIQSLEISISLDGKEEQPRIGSDDACGINQGAFNVEMQAKFYVEEGFNAIYNAARNGGSNFALSFTLGSVSGEKYLVEFPKCEFPQGELEGNMEETLFLNTTIRALYDEATGNVMKITRAVA